MGEPIAFEVVESLCVSGKGGEDKKEDRLVVTPRHVAVIDGATSSGPVDGRSGGIVAAETVAAVVTELAADVSARDFVEIATDALAARLSGHVAPESMPPSASVVVWSAARGEVWRIGDCHVRIDAADYPGRKRVDDIAYGYRCAVVRARLRLGLTSVEEERRIPTLRQPFMPLVSVQHAFLNLDEDDPLAYGCLCGTPVPERFIEVIPAGDAGDIVLCSDGFLAPAPTLAQGLAELDRVRRTDPLMIDEVTGSRPFPPGATVFDDTTYVRLRLAGAA